MSKFPSPLTNPDIQLGSGICCVCITGLGQGLYKGNSDFKSEDNPKFIEALRLITSYKPSRDFVLRIANTFLNICRFLGA